MRFSFRLSSNEAGIVKEGAALKPLPWEARGLDGLELPGQVVATSYAVKVFLVSVLRKMRWCRSVKKYC